jgi:hypothetical protein
MGTAAAAAAAAAAAEATLKKGNELRRVTAASLGMSMNESTLTIGWVTLAGIVDARDGIVHGPHRKVSRWSAYFFSF